MITWELKKSKLKRYPHFDKYLSPTKAEELASDPERVRTNPFFPFLCYAKAWQPFRPYGKPRKERLIRYASRRDSYIFARYRHLLADKYEAVLMTLGIQECPIAYRKVPVALGANQGKCNIHFAKDAFDRISALENSCAVTLDISSYFESLDHGLLRAIWCRVIEQHDLPLDHAAVFKAITEYSVVDRDQALERLGYIGPKEKCGRNVVGFLKGYKEMPIQLCTTKDFREKIAGRDSSYPSIIKKNKQPYGIPQGAPISDILSNIYLIDFDVSLAHWVHHRGGFYRRYSDDILIIVPGGADEGRAACDYARAQITRFGAQLQIKADKTSIVRYIKRADGDLDMIHVEGAQGKNGLEYLGFRFDGRSIYLRDSTLSRFYRKITFSLQHEARALVARFPGKGAGFLTVHFDLDKFVQKFGRVEDFDANTDWRNWTFWSYARRAADLFGDRGRPILRQVRGHREFIESLARTKILAALNGARK